MKEQRIELETAKLAKEAGFDYSTGADCWVTTLDGTFMHNNERDSNIPEHDRTTSYLAQPSQSLLHKWLRDNKKIHVKVDEWELEKWYYELTDGRTTPTKKIIPRTIPFEFDTYEQALEEGLKAALILISQCNHEWKYEHSEYFKSTQTCTKCGKSHLM